MTVPTNFSDKNTDDAIHAQWWIEIEGIRRRYGTTSPPWAPADTGTNRPILPYFTRIPTISGPKAKPLNGTSSPHEFGVGILDVDDSLTALFSTHDTSGGRTWMTGDIAKAATTLTVKDSSVFSLPCDIFVDAETMRATAAPLGTTLTVTRGMYGSVDVAHSIEDPAGNSRNTAVSANPTYFHARRCLLKESRAGLLEDDAITLRGTMDDYSEKNGVWSIECSGILKLLTGLICQEMPKTTLKDVLWGGGTHFGGYDMYDNTDGPGYAPATTWCMRCEDVSGFSATGVVKIDEEIISYTAKTDITNNLLIFEDIDSTDNDDYLKRVFMTHTRARFDDECFGLMCGTWETLRGLGANGNDATALIKPSMAWHSIGATVQTALGHDSFTEGKDAIAVILQILLSGGDGGTYDTLLDNCGLGLPEAQVDIDGMLDLRDELGLISPDLRFVITEPTEAKTWLEENVLRPNLLFFVERLDGTIGLSRLWTQAQAVNKGTDFLIDESVLVDGLPIIDTPKPPMGSFRIIYDKHPSDGKHYGEVSITMGDSIEKFGGLARNFEIKMDTVFSWGTSHGGSTQQAASMNRLHSTIVEYIGAIWSRYAINPMPIVKCRVPYNRLTDVQVGNIVTLTSSTLPDLKNSDRGVSGVYFQVIEASPNPSRCTVELTLWMIDVHDLPYREIAPAAKISAYTVNGGGAGFDKLDLYSDIFTSADNKDSDAFDDVAAGYYVTLLNSEHEELTAAEYMEVKDVGDDYIIIIGSPTVAPVDGDYVTIAPYGEAGSGAEARWAFGADANDVLGAGDDDAHRRE